MRVAAIIHPRTKMRVIRPFRAAGVHIFYGNTVEPPDYPDAALVFGGDGTVHRLFQSLTGSECPLLVVPYGSGNDFAASIGIRSVNDAIEAWHAFVKSGGKNVRTIDMGVIRPVDLQPDSPEANNWIEGSLTFADEEGRFAPPAKALGPSILRSHLHHVSDRQRHEVYFGCIAGTGLDAATTERANRMPGWWRAHGGYMLSAIKALATYKAVNLTLSVPNSDGHFATHISEPSLLVAIANGPAYGNGMQIAPRAKMDDGLLDICFVREISTTRVLRFMPSVYSGSHLELTREVEYLKTERVRLSAPVRMPVYADGEHVCDTPAEFSIRPQALKIIVPPDTI